MQTSRPLFPLLDAAMDTAKRLVLPSLVAIYEDRHVGDYKVAQIGTGFVVSWEDRALLITARHCLYGDDGNGDPATKSIFVGGQLQRISALRTSAVMSVSEFDVAALFVDDMELSRCLPRSAVDGDSEVPTVGALCGYLGKDFKRSASAGELKPQPYFLALTKSSTQEPGYLQFPYNIRKGVNPQSGARKVKPIPKGLSGCPILDVAELYRGGAKIAGVFTEYRYSGLAVGEDITKVCKLIP